MMSGSTRCSLARKYPSIALSEGVVSTLNRLDRTNSSNLKGKSLSTGLLMAAVKETGWAYIRGEPVAHLLQKSASKGTFGGGLSK